MSHSKSETAQDPFVCFTKTVKASLPQSFAQTPKWSRVPRRRSNSAIFPEFADRIQDDAKPGVLDPHPFDPGHLLLTVGGYFIAQSLKDRMRAVARAATHRSFTEAQMAELTTGAFPVVWIGMRLGDKSWADQEAGIQALAEGLFARHPGALILLDGFSYPVGRDEISGKWAAVIAELHALGARVMAALPGRAVVNLVGTTLADAVLWAERTDVYLTPVGSSQHKVGWLSQAPGLVYSPPRGARPLVAEKLPGSWEAEGSALPDYIIGAPVAAGQRRGTLDRRAHLDNVALDPQALLERLCALIDRLPACTPKDRGT